MRSSAVNCSLLNVVRLRRGFFAVVVGVATVDAVGTTAAVTVIAVVVAVVVVDAVVEEAVARKDAVDMGAQWARICWCCCCEWGCVC